MNSMLDDILEHDFSDDFTQVMQIYADSPYGHEFVEHMRNTVLMSHFKYGSVHDKPYTHYKMLSGFEEAAFEKDGNHEHLVNIANYAMFRYMTGEQTQEVFNTGVNALKLFNPKYYRGTDSDKSVVKTKSKPIKEHLRDILLKDIF